MKATLIPVLSVLVPTIAAAQSESSGGGREVAAVDSAFELGVSAGYSQGGGKLGGGMADLEDVAGPGAAIEIDVGYRVIPQLTIGAYGTFAAYDGGDLLDADTSVYGATAGIQAAWHIRPDRSVDPWISLGTGWKALWLDPDEGTGTSLQGLELARLQIGVDYRISKDIAIAPVIGGSLGMFLAEDSPMTDGYDELENKEVHFTGFAGLVGRFDLGGSRR